MTQSQQIIAGIYAEILDTVITGYLIAADAAEEAKDFERGEALRWLAENRKMPQIGPESGYEGPNWGWTLSSRGTFEPSNLDTLMLGIQRYNEEGQWGFTTDYYPTFEAAIEAFIEAWPKIKPKPKEPSYKATNAKLTIGTGPDAKTFDVVNWTVNEEANP